MGDWRGRSLVAMATAALAAAPLAADSTSGTMAVSVVVEESCQLIAQPMAFAAAPNEHDRVDARSSVVLACTPAASYAVGLDDGRHGAGGMRRMADASSTRFLAYELYSDAARTQRWGATARDGTGGIAPPDGRVELAVYGRAIAADAHAGGYADTITITVMF